MNKLILIRHGETDYTAEKRYCGIHDMPLNAQGIAQAALLCDKFQNTRVDTVYSSPLKRALETAKLAFVNRPITIKDALREIDFGKFSGLTWEGASSLFPDVYEKWLECPEDTSIPGGESVKAFARRVKKCFSEIASENAGKTVSIVTHGGVTRIILLELMGLGLDKFWTIEQDTAAVNIVEFVNGAARILEVNSLLWENSYSL